MRTDDLIVALAADAVPVEPLEPIAVRLLRWLAGAAVAVGAMVAIVGLRPGLAELVSRGAWLSETIVVVGAMGLAAVAMQASAVPGAAGARVWRVSAIGALAAWGVVLVWRLLSTSAAPIPALIGEPVHLGCALRIVIAAVIPGAIAWRQLRRAAPLHPGWTSALAALAALAAGAIAAALVCPLDRPAHGLIWHALPVVTLVGAAALIATAATRR